jgi:hypothetical protein
VPVAAIIPLVFFAESKFFIQIGVSLFTTSKFIWKNNMLCNEFRALKGMPRAFTFRVIAEDPPFSPLD